MSEILSNTAAQGATLVVDGFEHLGPITVRQRTVGDTMIKIPTLVDQLLGENMNPSPTSRYNALLVAIAQHAIISPEGLVDRVLQSSDARDISAELPIENPLPGKPKTQRVSFFERFSQEYGAWCDGVLEEVKVKKSGAATPENGKSSASKSATTETSSPLTSDG